MTSTVVTQDAQAEAAPADAEGGRDVPDVSVIVICFNDGDRLPRAVSSVLNQSLRNVEILIVDDCSTDGSFDVARRLAAANPDRVRALQLEENSGGCGEPRNRGISEARGTYVMFLDSDDELELDACRNMVEAAERTEADLVSGLTVRRHLDNRHGKTVEWYPWLYKRTQTLESVAELPDLLVWDTLSTNKCYRRDFLLNQGMVFVRGLHYEDLLFSSQAYVRASRITLIPNVVYYWDVVDKAAIKSISNSRGDIRNFTDRLEMHRRIDALLAERGLDELKLQKDIKFLKHDLVLHLRDLPFLGVEFRHEFAELARAYLDGIQSAAYDEVTPIHRICAYLLARDDWDNLMPAIDTLINRNKVSSPLVERDGKVYFCAAHLDTEEGRRLLDVTESGYHNKRIDQLDLRNQITGYHEGPDGATISGRIVNPLGKIGPDARLSARMLFKARRRSLQSFTFPVREVRYDGDGIVWETTADLARQLHPLGVIDAVWDVFLYLDADGRETRTALTVGDYDLRGGALPVRPRLTRLVADGFEPSASAKGHLAFVLTQHGNASKRFHELFWGQQGPHGEAQDLGPVGKIARTGMRSVTRTARRMDRLRKQAGSGDSKIRAYHEVLLKLPVVKGQVVFESHLGKQYSDSPRAIYEELVRRGVPIKPIWSYAGSKPEGFPKDVKLVKRWSWEYLRALAQAEFWVDNQGFPLKLAKRPETTYVQTWHGSALKRMGFDQAEYKVAGYQEQAQYQKSLDRFDKFCIRSEHDVRTLARAYRLKPEVLARVGYPRNDMLVAARRSGERDQELARELGIPEGRKVLLYAPTFRSHQGGGVKKFELPFDVERFADRFGDQVTLLMRCHYLNSVVLPPSVRGRVIDVSTYHDISPLLALADGLITDYSSVMFDYALLDRPIIYFTYDYEEYVQDTRGTYFDLTAVAPGPMVFDEEQLFDAVGEFEARAVDYAEARQRFVKEFGEYDQGDAAARIVDEVFLSRSSK
ncbi:bifunctional glycosyltransferase/CDP-glycerol:glycerophosphate glycerophosphotransferase [Phaeacidiphilus oryzae]|uniref:bifunctional glycosyltransferase/CDP-glycerol:glycerophosphate glycerophosphotransferase n=1 Tax=Phaeacidiphilus oryzae TaxID=348818 RepID=UPI000A00F3FE|nr:bifunctional glycosyltransferase family 2 protein/CDP-glycerol:glycerophosphate glycerophosphotransferase [Phaeacidiphilus oryzae]